MRSYRVLDYHLYNNCYIYKVIDLHQQNLASMSVCTCMYAVCAISHNIIIVYPNESIAPSELDSTPLHPQPPYPKEPEKSPSRPGRQHPWPRGHPDAHTLR